MKKLILIILSLLTISVKSQTIDQKTVDNYIYLTNYWGTVSPTKEAVYSKYVESNHGMNQNFSAWKKDNKFLYIKEIWYYAESFYIKRNVNLSGYSIDEYQIDISRFESQRMEVSEFTILIEGFKDAIVLIPNNKLIYKP